MSKTLEDLLSDQSFRRHVLNPYQADNANWKDWMNESDINKSIYDEAKNLILGFYEPLSTDEYEEETLKFRRRINITSSEKGNIISLYGQKERKTPLLKYAAVILALVTVSLFIYKFSFLDSDSFETQAIYESEIIKKEACKGQKLTIVFPDGTVVKLNSESQITYLKQFSENVREVELSGEAYFDVAHFENWPFVVKTSDTETKVLGTAFNLSAYPGEAMTRIALVKGSVQVTSTGHDPVILKPSEMISINQSDDELVITPFDFEKITGWKDNKIIFDKASFKEVQFVLERWYDVHFHCNKTPVFSGGYTGEFADQSLENILRGMGEDKFTFSIKGKNVYIN